MEVGLTMPLSQCYVDSLSNSVHNIHWRIDHPKLCITWAMFQPQLHCCRLGHDVGLHAYVYHGTSGSSLIVMSTYYVLYIFVFSGCCVTALHSLFTPTNAMLNPSPSSYSCGFCSFHSCSMAPRLFSSGHFL